MTENPSTKYPSLEVCIGLYKFLAYICFIAGAITVIFGIIVIGDGFMEPGFLSIVGGLLGGGVLGVSCLAAGEMIRLFINIERNTAQTAVRLVEGTKSSSGQFSNPQIPAEGVSGIEDIKKVMVLIDPGEFTMGSPDQEVGRESAEGPQFKVCLTQKFWIGKYPVTQGQWQALMGNNPSHFKNSGLNAPVESVSWDEAMEFARKLTEQERRAGCLPDGYVYTLPSEAQWEYAARAGTTTRFYTGNSDSDLGRAGLFSGNAGGSTKPVGQKVPNAWGLYDMHGNVWEWTRTWFGNYPGGIVVDYEGPNSGSLRVSRGGSWYNPSPLCRSASRYRRPPDYRNLNLGFRLALTPSP